MILVLEILLIGGLIVLLLKTDKDKVDLSKEIASLRTSLKEAKAELPTYLRRQRGKVVGYARDERDVVKMTAKGVDVLALESKTYTMKQTIKLPKTEVH